MEETKAVQSPQRTVQLPFQACPRGILGASLWQILAPRSAQLLGLDLYWP